MVKDLATCENLLILCGHYEGLDERIIELCIDEEVSIGDYVLTGGELPAMVMVDSVCRYVDGVIAKESLSEESFSEGLLEYPQYTRPQEFMGLKVPEVLTSGNHAEVDKWRKEKSLELTKKYRPDLLEK
jgi:tRNA (guanine37-N1)-methyltransferase